MNSKNLQTLCSYHNKEKYQKEVNMRLGFEEIMEIDGAMHGKTPMPEPVFAT